MAPGTRPYRSSITNIVSPEETMDVDANPPANDPWLPEHDQEQQDDDQTSEGFEDSFVVDDPQVEGAHAIDDDVSTSRLFEQNKEYLSYLESKLDRIERRKRTVQKISAGEVISSLKDVKEKHMEWCFRQGISSSEDDMLDSDSGHSSGSGNSLTSELRRKMFPEQQALNDTELLRLLDHDMIEKVLRQ